MSTQHTPGPWLARAIGTFNEPGYAVFWEDGSKSGVHTRRLDYKGCFTEADAHLIAAAPDMHEAVQRLLGWDCWETGRATEDAEFARDALAKAEGKS